MSLACITGKLRFFKSEKFKYIIFVKKTKVGNSENKRVDNTINLKIDNATTVKTSSMREHTKNLKERRLFPNFY